MTHLSSELDRLLRHPREIAEQARLGQSNAKLFVVSLLAIVVGAGLFGAALAASRGGIQIVFSAVKLPVVVLVTLVLVTPAIAALATTLRRPLALTGASMLMVAAAGRAALVLLSLAPIVWLAFDRGVAYHRGILVACICYGIAGFEALRLLKLALGEDLRSYAIIACFALVLAPAGGQTAWLLRPYVGRPSQAMIPFVRGRESSFGESVHRSLFSSMEIYR
ncbi:MAG TPA: hypothetical protein VIV60_28705 [Polyangiaceae bacterium]